jgi:hypothetical protein
MLKCVLKTHCHACGDVGTLWKCICCPTLLCVDKDLSSACIQFEDDKPIEKTHFKCPKCCATTNTAMPVSDFNKTEQNIKLN